ncbi:MAG: hypothetical protein AAF639_39210 [Chloroflexota bacterium]
MFILQPGVLLGLLISLFYAGLYQIIAGQRLQHLIGAGIMACIGFAVGQGIGLLTQVETLRLGQLYLLEASLCAWLAIFVGHLLMVARRTT